MKEESEPIALFDMDGTLCDYDGGLIKSLEKLRSPLEPKYYSLRDVPDYVQRRMDLIRSSVSWWENLEKFQLGWDILDVAKNNEFKIMILTQGPRRNPASWYGKKKWIDNHLGQDTDITITRDKGLVYGKFLVDDYPEYIDRWLRWRENGLVIMPANPSNRSYSHSNVIRYDGTNINQVEDAMRISKHRKGKSKLKL